MLEDLKKIVRLAFSGFPEHYTTRIGEIVAISDPSNAERASDRFRPGYAVDVQPLTSDGDPDPNQPVLEGLALPAFGTGDGRGFFAFPDVGTWVRIGYDYGLPSHPYIAAVLPEGRFLPALQPGELLIQQQDGCFLKFDAQGNAILQTNGTLTEDSHLRAIAADEAEETLGTLTRTVDGAVVESLGDLDQTILGGRGIQVGGDSKEAIVGAEERVVMGDKSELIVGKAELVAGGNLTLTSSLGHVQINALAGFATVYGSLGVTLLGAEIEIGNGIVELLALLDQLYAQLELLTVTCAAPGNPSSPPVNAPLLVIQQTALDTIKAP